MPPEPKADSAEANSKPRISLFTKLKSLCYGLIARGLYHSGMMSLARRLARSHSLQIARGPRFLRLQRDSQPKFSILCYHRVGIDGVPTYSRLHPKTFERQMRYLKRHYRIVPMGQLCRELREAREVPPTLAITFDDGYRDVYNYAFPVLREYSIPATVYLIARCMETGEAPWYDRIFLGLEATADASFEVELGYLRRFTLRSASERMAAAWEIICFLRSIPEARRRVICAEVERRLPVPEYKIKERMLNWNQVREMQRAGVEFGAHTMTHPVVSRLEPSEFPDELDHSKRLLEKGVGAPVEDFAYPFGKDADLNGAAESFLRECGYRSAVTTVEGFNSTGANLFALRRTQIGNDRSLARFSFNMSTNLLKKSNQSPAEPVWSEFADTASRRKPGAVISRE